MKNRMKLSVVVYAVVMLLLLSWKGQQEKHNEKDETKGDNVKGNHGDCAG